MTINFCECLNMCPAYFKDLNTSFSAVSWAHSPLSVSFSLFLWSAKAHIAMGAMHTAREDFNYESLSSKGTWGIIAQPLLYLSLHHFFWFAQKIQEFPKHHYLNQGHFYILIFVLGKLVLTFLSTALHRASLLVCVEYRGSTGSSAMLSIYTSWVSS